MLFWHLSHWWGLVRITSIYFLVFRISLFFHRFYCLSSCAVILGRHYITKAHHQLTLLHTLWEKVKYTQSLVVGDGTTEIWEGLLLDKPLKLETSITNITNHLSKTWSLMCPRFIIPEFPCHRKLFRWYIPSYFISIHYLLQSSFYPVSS